MKKVSARFEQPGLKIPMKLHEKISGRDAKTIDTREKM